MQSTVAGCCSGLEDCQSPWEACDSDEQVCVEVGCRPCESDSDCGADGNACLVLDGVKRCVVGCAGNPGLCPSDAACALSSGGGWVCLPSPGVCDAPDPTGDGLVFGDAVGLDLIGGGDLVALEGDPSSGCGVGGVPGSNTGIAWLFLLLGMIDRVLSAPRLRVVVQRRLWRSRW